MPLTQEQKNYILTQSGYDSVKWDVTEDGFIEPKRTVTTTQPSVSNNDTVQPKLPKPAGAGETFAREALHAAPAAAMGGVGVAAGAAAGTAVAPFLGPFAPAGPIVGGILGGLGLGAGTSIVQDKLEREFTPDYVARREANLAANPNAGTLGRLAAIPAGGFWLNPMNLMRAGSSAARIPGLMVGKGVGLTPPEIANLANVGGGAAIGTGVGIGQQVAGGKPLGEAITSRETLEALIGGALFNDPNAIGKKLGFQPVDWNPVARPDVVANASQMAEQRRLVAAEIAKQRRAAGGATIKPSTVTTQNSPLDLLRAVSSHMQPLKGENKDGGIPSIMLGEQQMFPLLSAEEAKLQQSQPRLTPEEASVEGDLQRSAHNQKVINDLNAQTEQAKLAKAQIEHQQAVTDLQQTLQKSQVAAPEKTVKPVVTTEAGKEIFPDYTGNVEADNAAPDPIQQLGDEEQTKLERRDMARGDGRDMVPAVRFKSGTVWKGEAGEYHYPLFQRWREAVANGAKLDLPEEGFVDSNGNFYTRMEAAKRFNKMFSTDLQEGAVEVPEKAEVERIMKEKGLTMEASVKYLQEAVNQGAKHKGIISGKLTPGLNNQGEPVMGSTFFETEAGKLKKVGVELNPETADISTPAHEFVGHAYRRFLKNSDKAGHRELIARGERLAQPLLEKVNRERAAKGQEPIDVEELLATRQGYEAILRHPEVSGEGALKQWFRDFKAHMKQQLGKSNEADIRRLIDLLYHSDTSVTAEQVSGVSGRNNMAYSNSEKEKAYQTEARAKRKAELEAVRGKESARSAGVKPNTYPIQETNVPRMDERALGTTPRTSDGKVKQGPYVAESTKQRVPLSDIVQPDQESANIIYHELGRAINSVMRGIRGRAGAWMSLKKADIQDIRSEAYADILENGVDRGSTLMQTLYRRAHDAVNNAVAEYKRTGKGKTFSFDKPIGETGKTLHDFITNKQRVEATADELAFQDMLDESAPATETLPAEEQGGVEIAAKTQPKSQEELATQEQLASLEEVFAPKENEKPVKKKLKAERAKKVSKNIKKSVAWYIERFQTQVKEELQPMYDDAVKRYGEGSDEAIAAEDELNRIKGVIEDLSGVDPKIIIDLGKLKSSIERRDMSMSQDDRPFVTSSEKLLSHVKGNMVMHDMLNMLKNKIPPTEFKMLEDMGIRSAFNKSVVNPKEVEQWIKENGPRVEIRKFSNENQSKIKTRRDQIRQRMAEINHELDTLGVNTDYAQDGQMRVAKEQPYQLTPERKEAAKQLVLERNRLNLEDAENIPAYAEERRNTQPHWSSVAPKNEKDMPGYVEIAVVKPATESRLKEEYSKLYPNDKNFEGFDSESRRALQERAQQFPSSHFFPPNTLGFVRGYMEGDTFHVIEVQSDWAQQQRQYKNRNQEDVPQSWRSSQDDPLLPHYERLAIKAAIEHARSVGAKKIAISDAETAMMTEGHDRELYRGYDRDPRTQWPAQKEILEQLPHDDMRSVPPVKQWIKQMEEKYDLKFSEHNGVATKGDYTYHIGYFNPEASGLPNGGYQLQKIKLNPQPRPKQEPGMRLHYDRTLQKIAEELTGSKGEKVSFGEHKMAVKPTSLPQRDLQGNQLREATYQPRKDLIFKNPDGTPKTDVSALSYNIQPRNDRFTLLERRNMSAYDIPVVGPALRKTIAAEVEKLKAESPEAAKAATDAYEKLRLYRGQLEQQTVRDIKNARGAQSVKEWITQDNDDYRAVVKWLDMKQDGKDPGFDLTPTQQAVADAVDKSNERTHTEREARPTLARKTGRTPYYLPHVMDRSAASVLANNPRGAEAQALKNDFIDYRTNVKGQSNSAAEADWKTIRSQFNIQEEGNLAARFGAIDKASGLGLPVSMRERNLIDRMARYNRRYARRLAYEDSIGAKDDVKKEFFDPETGIASTKAGSNVIQDIFGIREHQEATRNAASGLVRSLMLGPLTGAKDVVAGQFLGLQHMTLDQVLPAKQSAFRNYRDNFIRAIKTGVVRDNIGALESGEGGWNSIQSILERSRDIINVAQGRQLLENVSRTLNFGEGRHLVLDAFNAMKTGRLTETRRNFLDNFMPEWAKYKDSELPVQALDEAAARYVESVQGTYDQRGLPAWMMKGSFSPVFSLARWSVEKFNNFTKHVVEPAANGNYKPLLMATLGGVLGGEAITKLVEEVTGKKDRAPKVSEIAASKEKLGLLAYKVAALASMSGYAGVMGDVSKSVMDKYYGNRAQSWNNPLLDAMSTAAEDLSFINEAIQEGELPDVVDTIDMFLNDYIQAYRIAMSQMSDEKKDRLTDTNKRRDLKMFQMGEGLPSGQTTTTRPNPLLDKDMKEFKRTEDLREAGTMAGNLVKNVLSENKGNPERIRSELSKLRRNSYQTVPSPERSPIAFRDYKNFLTETQGPDVAKDRIKDYMLRNAKNRAKSSMIPSI